MAKPTRTIKKKIKKQVADGIAHVHASFNNTIITIHARLSLRRSRPTRPARR